VTTVCEPANRVWYVDLQVIPTSAGTGALDFAPFDFHKGAKKLPLVKLVDDFRVGAPGC
jgi:prolyl oligopeptidase